MLGLAQFLLISLFIPWAVSSVNKVERGRFLLMYVSAYDTCCNTPIVLPRAFRNVPKVPLCPPKVCSGVDSCLDLPLPAFLSSGHLVWSAIAGPFCKRRPAPSHSQGRETWSAGERSCSAMGRGHRSAFLCQMVSLANEVQSFHVEKKKEVSSFEAPATGGVSREPSLYDVLSYSYCYIGIMTGKSENVWRHHVCASCVDAEVCCCCCCFCMNPNCCLSLSHSRPLAQSCVSLHRLQCYFTLRWFLL